MREKPWRVEQVLKSPDVRDVFSSILSFFKNVILSEENFCEGILRDRSYSI